MTIKSSVAKGILEEIEKSHASDILLQARSNRELVGLLYQKGVLTDESIERAFSQAIVNEAKSAIEHMKKTGGYADNSCAFPEYLSYAIQEGQLTRSELRVIRRNLDHERDLDEFCKDYRADGLPSNLRDKFLNPPELPKFGGDFDSHPSCCSY